METPETYADSIFIIKEAVDSFATYLAAYEEFITMNALIGFNKIEARNIINLTVQLGTTMSALIGHMTVTEEKWNGG